jgi:hypothetical protein
MCSRRCARSRRSGFTIATCICWRRGLRAGTRSAFRRREISRPRR